MKFLYMTDLHLQTKIKSRKDDVLEAIHNKFSEIVSLATEHQVEAVVCGGDVFHTPTPSILAVRELVSLVQRLPVPFYSIPGQHDLYGYNRDTLYRTYYGLLSSLGVIRDIFEPVVIQGITFIDSRFRSIREPEHYDVEIVHDLLLPTPFFDRGLLIRDYKTKARLVLGADYHPGYDILEHRGTLFVHPGALLRLENTSTERTRGVKVALVEITKGEVSAFYQELQSAADGSSIFKEDLVYSRVRPDLSPFLRNIANTSFEDLELRELIHEVAEKLALDKEARESLVQRFVRRGVC